MNFEHFIQFSWMSTGRVLVITAQTGNSTSTKLKQPRFRLAASEISFNTVSTTVSTVMVKRSESPTVCFIHVDRKWIETHGQNEIPNFIDMALTNLK